MTEDEIEANEKTVDEYAQKQASVREVIYETISKSTFLQIKNEETVALMWARCKICVAPKEEMFEPTSRR